MNTRLLVFILGEALIITTPAYAPFVPAPLYQVVDYLDRLEDRDVVEMNNARLRASFKLRNLQESVFAELPILHLP